MFSKMHKPANFLQFLDAKILNCTFQMRLMIGSQVACENTQPCNKAWFLKSLSLSDPNQALRLCLGSTAMGAQYGAVSALSINSDCTRLLCGFAKGQVGIVNVWQLFCNRAWMQVENSLPCGQACGGSQECQYICLQLLTSIFPVITRGKHLRWWTCLFVKS